MAVTVGTIPDPIGTKLIIDADSNATAESNVTSGAAGTVYAIEIDNTSNTSVPVYTKLYQSTNPTVGTTSPDLQFKVGAGLKETYIVGGGFAVGSLSFWTVTSANASTNNNANANQSPTSNVKVKILCTF